MNMFSKIYQKILQHKFISGIIIIALLTGGYLSYTKFFGKDNAIRYVTAQVQKGTLIVSVSGSGQVSVSDQIDIKPKVSGDIVYVGVKNGEVVKAGTLIAQIDSRDAQKAVRDAEVSLESARLALEKLNLQREQQLRGDTLNKAYEDGLVVLSNLYGEFFSILDALNTILFGTDLSNEQNNINIKYYADYNKEFEDIPERLERLYREVKNLYPQSLSDYQLAKRGSGDDREKAIQSGYELTVKTAEMIKTGRDVVRYLQDSLIKSDLVHTKQVIIDKHSNDLTNYATSIDGYLKDLLTVTNTINNQRDALTTYPLDKKSQELTIKQRQNALLDAKEKLADYFIYAPFDGIIAQLNVKKGDSVSPSTILGTFITKQKIAEISLNEVDVAQIKVGQKATLTFDAVPDLTITGQVAEVDAVGTVSQGVVTYTVKIAFDTQDDRVKTAMSVSAAIVTEAKPNAFLVPNSAVKSQGDINYVEMAENENLDSSANTNGGGITMKNPPRQQQVTIGLSNDEFTEIVSGIKEGDRVVARTIQASSGTTQAQTQQPSGGFRIPGLPGGGRNMPR